MRIEELHLKNFCSFKELDINFPESNLAVFIGNNGAGKTSVLRSMILLFSWLIARIEREKGLGSPINELDILNGTHSAEIKIQLKDNDKPFEWSLAKTTKGKKKESESKLTEVSKLADIYRTKFTENDNAAFPLIIYYPVERSVLDVPLKITTKHNFSQLDGYDNALSQGVDFRRFFEWFRNREDIENENGRNQNNSILKLEIKLDEFKKNTIEIIHFILNKNKDNDIVIKELNSFHSCKNITEIFSKIINVINHDNINLTKEEKQILIDDTCSLKNENEFILNNITELENLVFDTQLSSVRNSIKAFIPNFDKLHIQRKPKLRLLVNKAGEKEPLDVLQLSQGEKSLMALVGDIARRLAMMNPTLDNPLEGTGIVLIDEIEMHLHPRWQRSIIPDLQRTFPNCQFIITTHSPQVLSRVHRDDIFILDNSQVYQPSSNPIGRDSNDILEEIMNVTKRPKEIQDLSDKYFSLLSKNLFEEAQIVRKNLEKVLDSEDPIFIRADALITRKNLL